MSYQEYINNIYSWSYVESSMSVCSIQHNTKFQHWQIVKMGSDAS